MPLKLIMGIFLLLMVILIGVSYLFSITGINKVIKFLADFDFTFSIILMLFIALFLNFNTFMFQTFTAFTIISFIFLK
jgi:glycine betaine transporter